MEKEVNLKIMTEEKKMVFLHTTFKLQEEAFRN